MKKALVYFVSFMLGMAVAVLMGAASSAIGRTSFLDHDPAGQSYAYVYFQLIGADTGKVWDTAAGALSDSAAWADADVGMTKNSTFKYLKGTIPSGLPSGFYDLKIYGSSDLTPDSGDTFLKGKHFYWSVHKVIAGYTGGLFEDQ